MGMQLRRVLACSTLDEASDEVVRAAHDVATRAGAELIVAAAFQTPIHYYGVQAFETAVVDTNLQRILWDEARDGLAQLVRRVGLSEGEAASARVLEGPPHTMLTELAKTLDADLIVVGASERSSIEQRILGSTADRIVRSAGCPVLLVRGAGEIPPRRVLAPVDLSPLSNAAFETGIAVLAAMSDELPHVELLHVMVPPRAGALPMSARDLEEKAATELERLRQSIPTVSTEGLTMSTVSGSAPAAILDRLGETHFDLAILGTHGRGGFQRFLLGSVANGILRSAPCSVLVVPPQAARHGAGAYETAGGSSADWRYVSDD